MNRISLKYLHESGLLFEINRQILHPLGLLLSFKPSTSSTTPEELIIFQTEDDEGFLFPEEAFSEGAAKFSLYLKSIGNERLEKRVKAKGFVRQTRSDQ
jgi:hypothetical protein